MAGGGGPNGAAPEPANPALLTDAAQAGEMLERLPAPLPD